jgi:hypothetical protein
VYAKTPRFLNQSLKEPLLRSQRVYEIDSFRLLIAALAVLLGGAIAKSQTADTPAATPPHARPCFRHGRPHDGFYAKFLNVTDDQKTQMKATCRKSGPR